LTLKTAILAKQHNFLKRITNIVNLKWSKRQLFRKKTVKIANFVRQKMVDIVKNLNIDPQVRGAPAIGLTGILSLAVELTLMPDPEVFKTKQDLAKVHFSS
jgi:methylthioribose-1-phosphate isomerase